MVYESENLDFVLFNYLKFSLIYFLFSLRNYDGQDA